MRRHLTFANVAAGLALFFSLAGGAYAAAKIDGGDVANESLTGKDLKNASIKARDVDGLGATITLRSGQPVTGPVVASGTAACQPGETLVSGGFDTTGNNPTFTITDAPAAISGGQPNTWRASIGVAPPGPGVSITVTAYALCAS